MDDGLERIFVNTAVKDGTTISEYMDCFLQKEVEEEAEKATKEAAEAKEACQRANITAIKNMIEFNIIKEDILKKYTVSEYEAAIAEIQCEKR